MRKTPTVTRIAKALLAGGDGPHWGYELSRRSGVRSGVMYTTLQRMVRMGWLVHGWESDVLAREAKRVPRHYYKITEAGKIALTEMASDRNRWQLGNR